MHVSVSRQLPGLGSSVLTNEAGVTIAFSIHESNKQQKNDSNPLKRHLHLFIRQEALCVQLKHMSSLNRTAPVLSS